MTEPAPTRGAITQQMWMGMGRNKSFGRPPEPYFSVRLMHIGHVGRNFVDYYGGSMTWDQLGSLWIKWGTNETIKYNGLQPGWTYWWELGTWDFIVTDADGNKTVEKIKTVSDLGITWDIFESPQFSIHITGKFENDAFLIAWRYKRGVKNPDDTDWTEPDVICIEQPYLWGEFDHYAGEYNHVKGKRLTNKDTYEGSYDFIVDIDVTGLVRTIILARIANLSATGNFPAELKSRDINVIVEKLLEDRHAEAWVVGNLLMIRMFASINNRGKPVYEPWMLWHLWQWLGHGMIVSSRDRTFDLSPWWG